MANALIKLIYLFTFLHNIRSGCTFDLSKSDLRSVIHQDVLEGGNVVINCCSGSKWSFHPETKSDPVPIKDYKQVENSSLFNTPNRYSFKDGESVSLHIVRANRDFLGSYICSNKDNSKSAKISLKLNTKPDYLVKVHKLLAKNKPKILSCPKGDTEKIILWKWRDLPPAKNGEEANDYIKIVKTDGDHGQLKVLSSMEKVEIKEPKSLKVPREVWCQVKTESNQTKFYEIRWQIYKPITAEIKALEKSSEALIAPFDPDTNNETNFLREGRSNRILCSLNNVEEHKNITVHWQINGKRVLTPPFEVNNENLSKLRFSSLYTSSYPEAKQDRNPGRDKIDCVVTSEIQFKSKGTNEEIQTLTSTITREFEVISQPKITEFKASKDQYAKGKQAELSCLFSANGNLKTKIEKLIIDPNSGSPPTWSNFNDGGYQEYKLTRSPDKIHLTLYKVDRDDHATYRCIVENQIGHIQLQTVVKVVIDPKVEMKTSLPREFYYQTRGPFIVNCSVTGYPLEMANKTLGLNLSCKPINSIKRSSFEEDSEKTIKLLSNSQDEINGFHRSYSVYTADLGVDCNVSCAYKPGDGKDKEVEKIVKPARPPKSDNYMILICMSSHGMVFEFDKDKLPTPIEPSDNITTVAVNYYPVTNDSTTYQGYTKMNINNIAPISIKNMPIPNTSYRIEWNFINELGMSSSQEMNLTTKPVIAPKINNISFVREIEEGTKTEYAIILDDPCPHESGREELSNFYLKFPQNVDESIKGASEKWSEPLACNITDINSKNWSGDKTIRCTVEKRDGSKVTKISASSRNRYTSDEFHTFKVDQLAVMSHKSVEPNHSVQLSSVSTAVHASLLLLVSFLLG